MKIDIQNIKDKFFNHIVVVAITMVLAQTLWFIAKGVHTIFKSKENKEESSMETSIPKDDDILGV